MTAQMHDEDSTESEVAALADAFRQATDDDTVAALTYVSQPKINEKLKYYVVPAKWMFEILPVFQGKATVKDEDWKSDFKVENVELSQQLAGNSKCRHYKDYCLLGSNAWLLIKLKLGCDREIELEGILRDRKIEIKVNDHETVTVPEGGHFGYDRGSALLNYLSDDETVQDDDLFPGLDNDRMLTDENDEPDQPVILSPLNSGSKYSWEMVEAEPETVTLRKYGSGLANLGNTCFMNSMLQSLAHTPPLMKYFLSGDYENDLNRDNPLGTGGDLTTQFAELMSEIWGLKPTKSYSNSSNVVYPRDFKYTLGKHAEQFVGYDQHDSQEFVTFLLDALHEDTNRVRKKPYIEKPEQREDELDQEAADRAWDLCLKRDDSRILDYFMGQIKSRVQCNDETCNRISTTYDPCMYLSVPVPGSDDRTINVTFVPLDPKKRNLSLACTVNKHAGMMDLLQKVREKLKKIGYISDVEDLPLEDLKACDLWHNEIYNWYDEKSMVEDIRETDVTYIYQLLPINVVREMGKQEVQNQETHEQEKWDVAREKYFRVDISTEIEFRGEDQWKERLKDYLEQGPLHFLTRAFGRYGSHEDRVQSYTRLTSFIDQAVRVIRKIEGEGEGGIRRQDSELIEPSKDEIEELVTKSDISSHFRYVKSRYDVMILERCAYKMRREIIKIEEDKRSLYPDGVVVQVRVRKVAEPSSIKEEYLGHPLVLRLAQTTTVFDLRQILANRYSRSLREKGNLLRTAAGEPTSEMANKQTDSFDRIHAGPIDSRLLQQAPLQYERKGASSYRGSFTNGKTLGMIERSSGASDARAPKLAVSSDKAETEPVGHQVGDFGTIFVDFDGDLAEYFDTEEFESAEDPEQSNSKPADASEKGVTVLDCIKKYCQKEQLEETEMWYCNKCQKHVQAWKQFHLYRAPQILIVHLKRFQFSARTHRRDKIGVFVDFPLEGLDLCDLVMSYTDETKPIYDCYAVSNHFGGLGGGHYTAYCLNDDGKWCYYDDSRITEDVDPKDVVTSAAYVLCYRRRDVDTSLAFLSEIKTKALRNEPAVIGGPASASWLSSDQDSNAAMIGDDDMDVDDASAATSPMQSALGDEEEMGELRHLAPDSDDMPLQ